MEEADETDFAPALMEKCWHRYDEIIQAGWAPNTDYHPGKHAKKRPEQVYLLDRRDSHREEVLRFATDLRVPFARNGSERDIRPLTIKMKASSVLPTMVGAKAFCRLRSHLSVASKQSQSAFTAMTTPTPGCQRKPAKPAELQWGNIFFMESLA